MAVSFYLECFSSVHQWSLVGTELATPLSLSLSLTAARLGILTSRYSANYPPLYRGMVGPRMMNF